MPPLLDCVLWPTTSGCFCPRGSQYDAYRHRLFLSCLSVCTLLQHAPPSATKPRQRHPSNPPALGSQQSDQGMAGAVHVYCLSRGVGRRMTCQSQMGTRQADVWWVTKHFEPAYYSCWGYRHLLPKLIRGCEAVLSAGASRHPCLGNRADSCCILSTKRSMQHTQHMTLERTRSTVLGSMVKEHIQVNKVNHCNITFPFQGNNPGSL